MWQVKQTASCVAEVRTCFGPTVPCRIVAIGALDQALVDPMVEWHFELGLFLQMARVTELRLCFHQQKLFGLRMVRRMTGDATDVVLRVDRVDGVHVLRATGVATHTAGVDFLAPKHP